LSFNKTWRCAVAGGASGLLAGFFGGGGGMLLVPLLIRWCKIDERTAFATSVAIIFPLCIVSAAVYWFRGGLDLMAALPYLIGGLLGGFVGGKIYRRMNMTVLRCCFGLLLLYGGIRALIP